MAHAKILEEERYSLVQRPTPLYQLQELGKMLKHENLYIKREDLTAEYYGGNKVRNLEMIFAEAKMQGAQHLVTAGPRGSNFIAALSAQAARHDFSFEVHHFTPHLNAQIRAHNKFSEEQIGGSFLYYQNHKHFYLNAAEAFITAKFRSIKSKNSYFVAPGGSSTTGAIGHFFALLEMAEQKIPDDLFVGVGTCGTIAGLLAAKAVLGLATRIIGVRCVDPIVCNRSKIVNLANRVLQRLGYSEKLVQKKDVILIDPPQSMRHYGHHSLEARHAIEQMKLSEQIRLDTTYTAKSFFVMRNLLGHKEFRNRKALYWHTFSDKAL